MEKISGERPVHSARLEIGFSKTRCLYGACPLCANRREPFDHHRRKKTDRKSTVAEMDYPARLAGLKMRRFLHSWGNILYKF
jgi:hypothetical protein